MAQADLRCLHCTPTNHLIMISVIQQRSILWTGKEMLPIIRTAITFPSKGISLRHLLVFKRKVLYWQQQFKLLIHDDVTACTNTKNLCKYSRASESRDSVSSHRYHLVQSGPQKVYAISSKMFHYAIQSCENILLIQVSVKVALFLHFVK